jgi:hypothetical protein
MQPTLLTGRLLLSPVPGRGIGVPAARLELEAGAKVVIGDVLDERGRKTATTIAGPGCPLLKLRQC